MTRERRTARVIATLTFPVPAVPVRRLRRRGLLQPAIPRRTLTLLGQLIALEAELADVPAVVEYRADGRWYGTIGSVSWFNAWFGRETRYVSFPGAFSQTTTAVLLESIAALFGARLAWGPGARPDRAADGDDHRRVY